MADTVDTIVQFSGGRRYNVRLTNVSDGTGESAVIKVDKSTLLNAVGLEPGALNLESVQWSIQGFTSVRLFWDHTTDDEMEVLGTGNGYRSYADQGSLNDPKSAGGTGDVLLTTANNVSGATYDIQLNFLMA